MAQRRQSRSVRIRKLARRFGVGERGVVLACACLVAVLLLVIGLVRAGSAGGIEIDRVAQMSGDGTEVIGGADTGATNEADDSTAGGEVPDGGDGKSSGTDEESESGNASVVVHVDGAVAAPGVYELVGENVRINDAVERAGGLTPDADTSYVNLASPVTDGQKVHIPREGEQVEQGTMSQVMAGNEGMPAGQAQAEGQSVGNEGQPNTPGLVNINSAGRDELMTLVGVGEATADAIIEERTTNGPFSVPEDLMRVSGIGEKKFAKMRDSICV